MTENLFILFVEDLITDYELALYEIKKVNPDIKSKRVDTKDAFEKALTEYKPGIIVSDYIMPQFNGMMALEIKQRLAPDIPFIMLTGSTNEETAVECMKAGADDYVIKEHIRRLPLCVTHALENAQVRKEIKHAQQEIARREIMLRNAVNNLPSTLTIYDSKGRIEYMNEYGLVLSNISIKDAIGKRDDEIFPPEMTCNYLGILHKSFETKEMQITECMVNFANIPRYVIYYFIPTLDDENNIYKVLGIAYDITERKEAEENLKVAIKRAEEYDLLKSAFLANISHEIRTPLNAIMGFSQMIKKLYGNDDQLTGYVDIIMLSSNQLLDIIKEMIEISQLVSGKSNMNITKFSLNEMMKELYENFQMLEDAKVRQGIKFIFDDYKGKNSFIETDRDKLIQIMKGLLSNAFKFTFNGSISYGFKQTDPGIWHFYVKDTGIGIQEDKLDLIFDIFRQGDDSFTRQYGGVGLGLTICRELVNLLGGEIWVESVYGKGSTFNFLLPEKKKT